MSAFRLILVSLLHHRRMNFAVAFGVVAGTAVLTGALLVGDSVRGSLRHLTLDRPARATSLRRRCRLGAAASCRRATVNEAVAAPCV
ncbi:MAG TPA: hypothetical protein VMV69_27875 [Pirellulales bacterium]|nr:hypothetical protein [Pirellulales bacterium]